MQIVENLIQTGIQALCITPSGSREIVSALVKAKRREGADRHRRHARRREGRGRRRRARPRRSSGPTTTRAASSPASTWCKATGGKARVGILEGIPGPRDRRLAAARLPRRGRRRTPGIDDRRVAAGELGARSGLQRVPEHAAGAPRHRQRVRLQRSDGARRRSKRSPPPARPARSASSASTRSTMRRRRSRRGRWRRRWRSFPSRWGGSPSRARQGDSRARTLPADINVEARTRDQGHT